MSVRIITDSTVDLAPAIKAQVTAVPLSVRFGQQEYLDGVTIDAVQFYEMLAQSEELPTTSQPTPAAFEDAFRDAVEAGDDVVCITISSRLSGTYQSATIAADEFPGKVFVVDSRTAAIGAGLLAEYALQLAGEGMSAEQILHILMEKRKQIRLYAIVDTLEYLKKGGRLSSAVAVVGGLLNIKPIICIGQTGEITVPAKARGMKAAFAQLTQLVSQNGGVDPSLPALLGYTGGNRENLDKYQKETAGIWPEGTQSTIVGSAIGVHVGPGAVAVSFFSAE